MMVEQIMKRKKSDEEICDPAQDIGILSYPGTDEDLEKEIRHLRNEWERFSFDCGNKNNQSL